jgi:plasmid stability protein
MSPTIPEYFPDRGEPGDRRKRLAFASRAAAHYNAIIDCTETAMPSITIRNLDERTKERLRVRAARCKRSMEDEARNILRAAVLQNEAPARNLAEAIRRRFEPLGGVKLPLPRREPMREPPKPVR